MSAARQESARRDWEEGERRLERARRDPARGPVFDRVVEELRRELSRRLGQTYTLDELVDEYERSGWWTRDVAIRIAPEAPWAHDLSTVADPVFAAASRRASDWSPYGDP